MRRRHEPKKDFFLTETHLDSGIQRIKDLNYGIYSMEENLRVKTSGSFP
jgi:hypothetical protein